MQKTKLRLQNVLGNINSIPLTKRRKKLLQRNALYVALNIVYLIDYAMLKKTCSPSCSQKLRNRTLKPTDWIEDAIKMRQDGMILSDIALRVNRSTSTVWKQLKMNGVDK